MNRLVIVGNGFDLAHGLPTGYCDFINWYWRKICKDLRCQDKFNARYEDDFLSITIKFRSVYAQDAEIGFQKLSDYESLKYLFEVLVINSNSSRFNFDHKFKFKNIFFGKINEAKSAQNWVDIENIYYEMLKDCILPFNKRIYNVEVKQLNEEFDSVKNILEEYLVEEIEKKYLLDINNEFFELLKRDKYSNEEVDDFYQEFQNVDMNYIRRGITEVSYGGGHSMKSYSLENITFLNFNYTSLIKRYVRKISKENYFYNQIHGELKLASNPINFGFGDEMDKNYSQIEEINDNEYLKNMKSFAYSNTPNYKELLDLIDSEKFQVYIMGHSCGLSDRTLLNTIFEHENCKSIKIFYYEFDKPKSNGIRDNYTEIVQNVSRHFNKKKLMREKIVNKTLCQPLPQIKLKLKENGSQ